MGNYRKLSDEQRKINNKIAIEKFKNKMSKEEFNKYNSKHALKSYYKKKDIEKNKIIINGKNNDEIMHDEKIRTLVEVLLQLIK